MGIREIKVMGAGSNSRVVKSGVTYPILVTLPVFQLLMLLLNVDVQPLSGISWLMSMTRDTCNNRQEQGMGDRGCH